MWSDKQAGGSGPTPDDRVTPPSPQPRATRWDTARPLGQAPAHLTHTGSGSQLLGGPARPPQSPPPSAPPHRGSAGVGENPTCARHPHAKSAFGRALRLWWGRPLRVLGEGPTGPWASPDPLPGFCPEHPGFPGVQLVPGNEAEGSHTDRHQGPGASGDVSRGPTPRPRGCGVEEPGQDSEPPPTTSVYGARSPIEGTPPGSSKGVWGLLPVAETTPPAGGHSKGQRTPALDVQGCRAPWGRRGTGVRRPGAD